MSLSKMIMGQSGNQGSGLRLDVDEVFSIDLFAAVSGDRVITNGIDLSGEGGMVWNKCRNVSSTDWYFGDTARGVNSLLRGNTTAAEQTISNVWTFANNGVTLKSSIYPSSQEGVNYSFRKAKKFFDIVTYTGTGGSRTLNHNLGSTPGMIIVKDYSNAGENWTVYHRGINVNGDNAPETDGIYLNTTGAAGDESGFWNDTAPTSTQFTVGGNLNSSFGGGANYVAYLFAHNDGDGTFGPDADQDIIKCGSYTGNGNSNGPSVNLGFEPQWVMVKNLDTNGYGWIISDDMRGFNVTDTVNLNANESASETQADIGHWAKPTQTGFTLTSTSISSNGNGTDYAYMAIRRGSLFPPTDATKVFSIDTKGSSAPYFDSNHIVDMALVKSAGASGDWYNYARIIGEKYLATNTTANEFNASEAGFDFMNGHIDADWGGTDAHSWMWKRAPSYFDVVAYTGNGASNRQISHNLGVQPEMIWIKRRSATDSWHVSTPSIWDDALFLNTTDPINTGVSGLSGASNLTATNFSVASGGACNGSGQTYIAYLFATVAGVSKVGSFVGSDSDQTIDCGFSSGARFVLIKCTTSAQNWAVWDTTRGIVSGNEPYLVLDRADAEITGQDRLDPHSSGFTVAGNFTTGNDAGESYIFYAIA